ncbi:hypothetical protein [Allochromatium palmeri]|uniref:DUF4340 domain-containing protein n=1 Tax=Allochromatium palmeri TaxID=231048 RepID=A0A6N8EDM8_9GAMM|nr:hypothetical protein [Allochromatium palmeri]MTW22352.1 hypothetical protein [Allochromatium palmeri]
MSGRWLINGLLLVVLAVLVVAIRAELERTRFVPTLTDLAVADLYRVEIARTGEPTITLIQTAIGWRLETPFQVDADNGRVTQLLGLLEAPVERSFPAQSVDLRELGLSPVRLRLALDARELQFGVTDPIGQTRYVASEGLVHLIQDRFYHLLIAPPIDYVSPQLVPRGFGPVFGRLGGVPLTPETLNDLMGLHAERVEVLAETPSGAPVALKSDDGTTLRFLVSEDRRRWARLDQRLLYVLTDAPELTLDPNAVDPTPPEPQPLSPRPALFDELPESVPSPDTPPDAPMASDPFAQPAQLDDSMTQAPEPIVPSDGQPGEPTVVRLSPDGRAVPVEIPEAEPAAPEFSLPGEPYKAAPSGFGQDPFAPDPSM